MQYATSIMTDPAKRANIQHGLEDFDAAVAKGGLPAVTFLKPGDDDGHPGYSTLAAFEAFVTHAVAEVQNNPSLWKDSAIFVTFDEGGGYYDSGYVQPVSFFGDGTRVPMVVISPYAKRGFVSHTYTDHVSILKFIERNWGLATLSHRSLDNLPNPVATNSDPYKPTNGPAIGDMFDYFDFDQVQASAARVRPHGGQRTSARLARFPDLLRCTRAAARPALAAPAGPRVRSTTALTGEQPAATGTARVRRAAAGLPLRGRRGWRRWRRSGRRRRGSARSRGPRAAPAGRLQRPCRSPVRSARPDASGQGRIAAPTAAPGSVHDQYTIGAKASTNGASAW